MTPRAFTVHLRQRQRRRLAGREYVTAIHAGEPVSHVLSPAAPARTRGETPGRRRRAGGGMPTTKTRAGSARDTGALAGHLDINRLRRVASGPDFSGNGAGDGPAPYDTHGLFDTQQKDNVVSAYGPIQRGCREQPSGRWASVAAVRPVPDGRCASWAAHAGHSGRVAPSMTHATGGRWLDRCRYGRNARRSRRVRRVAGAGTAKAIRTRRTRRPLPLPRAGRGCVARPATTTGLRYRAAQCTRRCTTSSPNRRYLGDLRTLSQRPAGRPQSDRMCDFPEKSPSVVISA
jgi:hypothetical protein